MDPPIAPVVRYWVRAGATASKWGSETTRFEVFGESKVRLIETVKTYLCWWGLVPVVLVPLSSRDELPWGFADVPSEFGPVLFSASLMLLYVIGWALYGSFLRPVRQGRRVPAPPPPRRPRWPDPEDDMWK